MLEDYFREKTTEPPPIPEGHQRIYAMGCGDDRFIDVPLDEVNKVLFSQYIYHLNRRGEVVRIVVAPERKVFKYEEEYAALESRSSSAQVL